MKDAFVLYPRDKDCPCESGVTAGACCFREQPPITADEVRFNSLNLDVKMVDQFGRTRPAPPQLQFQVGVNQPGQVEQQIEGIAQRAVEKIEFAPGLRSTPMRAVELSHPFSRWIEALAEALYSCRYHQIQFLFRLDRVVKQQLIDFKPSSSPYTVRINDRPLHIELESFLISTTSSLDMLSQLVRVSLGIGNSHNSFKKVAEHLARQHPDLDKQIMNDILGVANDSWVKTVRDLRNRIVHEASFDAFQGVGHQAMLVLDAKIANVPAGEFVVTTWRQLRELALKAIQAMPTYQVGFDTIAKPSP